jgi:hypothetical protein
MTTRRGGQTYQVKPRPPSTGRPAPERVRPRQSPTFRTANKPQVESRTRRRPPFILQILFAAAVIGLGIWVLQTSTGGLGRILGGIGSGLGGAVRDFTATPVPSVSIEPLADAPTLIAPTEPYTNQPIVDLAGATPADVAGRADYKIHIYGGLKDQEAQLVRVLPVGRTPSFTVPNITLEKGVNLYTATLVGPAGETEPSAQVTYVYDTSIPKIILSAPRDGQTVNGTTVDLVGKVQSRSVVVARNSENGTSATAKAGPDGGFTMTISLEPGPNPISMTATDPAGNVGELVVEVLRGEGKLTANLQVSPVTFRISKLPQPVTVTTTVTDPDGRVIEGATAVFTLSVPGLGPITHEATTGATGQAVLQTTVPQGATEGTGVATVLVSTRKYGDMTAQTSITVKP